MMNAREFKQESYNAYMAYVQLIEGQISLSEALEGMAAVFSEYGYALNAENIINTLTVKMTAYGTDHGDKVRKVKSIATFRAFIKGGWSEIEDAPVKYSAGKNPADQKAKKRPSKTEEIELLKNELAVLRAQLRARESEEG